MKDARLKRSLEGWRREGNYSSDYTPNPQSAGSSLQPLLTSSIWKISAIVQNGVHSIAKGSAARRRNLAESFTHSKLFKDFRDLLRTAMLYRMPAEQQGSYMLPGNDSPERTDWSLAIWILVPFCEVLF
ncbi:MAG: hypothetical protein JSS95_02280 [Acidobacteria bacterium]|nr:hypothetical protein [Acidobacteriota bacterium]